jgi:hypothetical protein
MLLTMGHGDLADGSQKVTDTSNRGDLVNGSRNKKPFTARRQLKALGFYSVKK